MRRRKHRVRADHTTGTRQIGGNTAKIRRPEEKNFAP
jgi:hypothetical protein